MAFRFTTATLFALLTALSYAFVAAHHSETFTYIKKPLPNVPESAMRSGYCCMLYDIDRDGRTQNVEATYCTDEVYRQESIRTLSSWVYDKKRQDGTPVAAYNITASIAYRIEDMMGVPISGPHEFMTPLSNGEYYMERICSPLIG